MRLVFLAIILPAFVDAFSLTSSSRLPGTPSPRLGLPRPCLCSVRASESKSTPDGRTYRIFADEESLSRHVKEYVGALAASCIKEKGAFSMSIGSGTTVKPLSGLAGSPEIDFARVHVFFGNERTTGDTAFKCYEGAAGFVDSCGVPRKQVYRVPEGGGDPARSAAEYEALIRSMPASVLGRCDRSGLPALDLVLLGSGADGHTASLYPGSSQVLQSPSDRLVVHAEGKGGVTLTLDALRSARHVVLSAGKASQAAMVAETLGGDNKAGFPAGMIGATPGETSVEWLLTAESAGQLKI